MRKQNTCAMKKYKQEDLKRTLGEPETAAYALSGQKKVRKAVRTEVDGVSRLEGIFRLYENYKTGDTSVYETLREKLEVWYRRHNTPEAIIDGISVSEKQILNRDVLTAEEAAEETRRIFGWQR